MLRTLEPPPERLGVTHWSSGLLAAELGHSNVKVAQVWREYGLQPWRVETFKFSTDPQLEAMADGLASPTCAPQQPPRWSPQHMSPGP